MNVGVTRTAFDDDHPSNEMICVPKAELFSLKIDRVKTRRQQIKFETNKEEILDFINKHQIMKSSI